jgi:hypothetical protein
MPQRACALALAAALLGAVVLHPREAPADPPRRVRAHRRHPRRDDARRDSDRMRRRRRYEQTLDPTTTRRGRPIQVARATPPVAFGPAPAPRVGEGVAARPYDHVVIVSLDGLRPDAIDLTDAPNLRLLRDQGANGLEARTITHSYTLPSHTSMLTGVDTDQHGLLHNNFVAARGFVRVPTVFYYAHDAGLATAMFVSKPKLRHIAVPGSVDVFARPDYACSRVVAAAAEYLAHAGPGLTFVHLSEPDEHGHARGWMTEAYLRGIADADRCLGTLLTALGQRRDLDRILLLVSADHGGHGRTHGSERDEDMRIPWIAWGSRVVRGPFTDRVSTMDTAATALAALGIPVPPDLVGRPVQLVFTGPTASPSPGPLLPALPDAAPPRALEPDTTTSAASAAPPR